MECSAVAYTDRALIKMKSASQSVGATKVSASRSILEHFTTLIVSQPFYAVLKINKSRAVQLPSRACTEGSSVLAGSHWLLSIRGAACTRAEIAQTRTSRHALTHHDGGCHSGHRDKPSTSLGGAEKPLATLGFYNYQKNMLHIVSSESTPRAVCT